MQDFSEQFQAAGGSNSLFNAECRFCTLPETWRIVHESPNFVVQMGLGPLVEGYVLILTRAHFSCFAALDTDLLTEFLHLLDLVQRAQRKAYQCSLFFEHGRSGACLPEGQGEDLCYHAHLHLIPSEVQLAQLVSADFKLELFRSWREVISSYQRDQLPYILTQDGADIRVARTPDRIPKRYLRTKLATALGEPALADWVAFPSYTIVRSGWSRMRAALDSAESS